MSIAIIVSVKPRLVLFPFAFAFFTKHAVAFACAFVFFCIRLCNIHDELPLLIRSFLGGRIEVFRLNQETKLHASDTLIRMDNCDSNIFAVRNKTFALIVCCDAIKSSTYIDIKTRRNIRVSPYARYVL
jgi:hypothetical protein